MKKINRILTLMLCIALTFVVGCNDSSDSSSDTIGSSTSSGSNGGFDIDDLDATQGNSGGDISGSSSGIGVGSNDDQGIDYKPPLEIDKDDNNAFPGRVTDLKGKTFKVRIWQPYMTGKSTDSPLLTSRYKELCEKIEKEYNCKIINAEMWNDTSIMPSVAAGKPSVDLWWINTNTFISAYKSGFLTNLSDLDVFDFNDRSRFSHATEMCNINGQYYGVAPRTYGIIPVYTNDILFANLDLLADCGVTLENLRSWQKNKEWNWDKFREVLQKVKNNNGKNGYATYGVNDANTELYQALMNANGIDWVNRDSKGNFTFTGGSKAGQNVLNYYSSLYKDGLITYNENIDQGAEFGKGEVAFYCGGMSSAVLMGGNWSFNYAMMYPPMGNDVDSYMTAGKNYSYVCIPKGSKPSGATDAEIATVLYLINTALLSEDEDLSQMASDYAFAIKNQLSNDTVYDIYAQGTPKIMWNSMTYGIGLLTTDQRGGWYEKVHSIAESGGANMASVLAEVTDSYNAKLKDIFK